MVQPYCPDPDDSDLVFNIPLSGFCKVLHLPSQMFSNQHFVFNLFKENDHSKLEKTDDTAKENETSDSDEAPDDVPFSTSKSAALSIREAEEQVKKKSKEDQKKRRQKKEDLMKEQKEEKLKRLESLASKRLPEDLVDNISSQPVKQDTARRQKKMKTQEVARVHTSRALLQLCQQSFANFISLGFEEEHYIPLELEDGSSTDFSVAILESKKWKNKFSKPGYSAPKNFRQQMLFGRSVKRESSEFFLSFMVEQLAREIIN